MDAMETLPFDVYGFAAPPSPKQELPVATAEIPDPILSLPTLILGEEIEDVFEEPKVPNQTDQSIPPNLSASHVAADGEQPCHVAAPGNGGGGADVPKTVPESERPPSFNAMNHQARSLLISIFLWMESMEFSVFKT